MYCPGCGIENIQGGSFCKRCGSNLVAPVSAADLKGAFSRMMEMLLPVSVVGVIGLVGMFVTAVVLAHKGVPPRTLTAIVFAAGATLFGIIALMIWLLLRLSGIFALSDQTPQPPRAVQPDRSPAQVGAPPSVVEHTTRSFEPSIYKEPGSR